MITAYIPYIMLLAVSPVLGKYMLRFVYPDIKTFVKAKKWSLFAAFGLLAYLPAAILSISELIVPVYSPAVEGGPLLLESEVNALFMAAVFAGMLVINSSVVDFILVRRKKSMIVGVPKHVIAYGIKQQIVESKKAQRKKEISKITTDLEGMAQGQEEVKTLLEKIRLSVLEGKNAPVESLQSMPEEIVIAEKPKETVVIEHPTSVVIEHPKLGIEHPEAEEIEAEEKEVVIKAPEEAAGKTDTLEDVMERLSRPEPEVAVTKSSTRIDRLPFKTAERDVFGGTGEDISETKRELREALAARRGKPITEEELDENRLMDELESKLKSSAGEPDKAEKVQQLLGELREKIGEDYETKGGGRVYPEGDIEEITNALRAMKHDEEEVSKKSEERRGHAKAKRRPEEEIGESLFTYDRTYSRGRGEEDVLKTVVGDVRQQLGEGKKSEEEEAEPSGKRWYEKGEEEAPKPKAGYGEGPEFEMFEQDMSFGEGLGELGELGEGLEGFGDLGSLEGLDQNLESSEFDGMFVDMGKAKGGCPNCGKKGTSIAYCSSCGKPLCSNCADSVEGSEEFVKYKCPHCKEDFAMRRRLQA